MLKNIQYKLNYIGNTLVCRMIGTEYNWYDIMKDEFERAIYIVIKEFNLSNFVVKQLYDIDLKLKYFTLLSPNLSKDMVVGQYEWYDYNTFKSVIKIWIYRFHSKNPYIIVDTIRHEIAHHFDHVLYSDTSITKGPKLDDHGENWKNLCLLLDCEPTETSTIEDCNFYNKLYSLNHNKFDKYLLN